MKDKKLHARGPRGWPKTTNELAQYGQSQGGDQLFEVYLHQRGNAAYRPAWPSSFPPIARPTSVNTSVVMPECA